MSAMHSAPNIFRLYPSIIPIFPPAPRRPFGWARWDVKDISASRRRVSRRRADAFRVWGFKPLGNRLPFLLILQRKGRDPVRPMIAAVVATASLVAALSGSPPASAQSVEEFYKSRPVTIMVGFNV